MLSIHFSNIAIPLDGGGVRSYLKFLSVNCSAYQSTDVTEEQVTLNPLCNSVLDVEIEALWF